MAQRGINMKSLGYNAKVIRALIDGRTEDDDPLWLGRINGIATEFFTGESENGEWVGFRGDFVAVNKDGAQKEGRSAFFPLAVGARLHELMKLGQTDIEVKVDIYVVPSDKAVGYAYICEPVMSEKAKSRMGELRTSLMKDLPVKLALAAPTNKPGEAAPAGTNETAKPAQKK